MPDSLLFFTLVVTLTFALAGFVKGVIGLGLPTVAIGLLGLLMTPAEAAALLLVPSLVTNVWQLMAGRGLLPLLRRFWPMLLGCGVGTFAGAIWFGGGVTTFASTLLGVALVVYALIGLRAPRFSISPQGEGWLSPLAGVAGGVVASATGVFVLPVVPYLQALGLQKDELVQALGLSFTVSTVALGMMLTAAGMVQPSVAGTSVFAVVPALGGMYLGQRVRARVNARTFRLCFFSGLLILGVHLAARGAT